MRNVRSADPVAMRWPVGFHAMVRILEGGQWGAHRGGRPNWKEGILRVGAGTAGRGIMVGFGLEGGE